ncbi:MAG: phosphoribosylanthranilate isomerase [Bacteroidota bacterium]
MREVDNILALDAVKPDFMGMIFYDKSPRDASLVLVDPALATDLPRVGVFVNPKLEEVMAKAKIYNLSYIQLHGDESEKLAKALKDAGLGVIKVFRLEDSLPVQEIMPFEGVVDFFLFDTKTQLFGGSGQKFNWDILKNYPFDTPYFLSGGIELDDIENIKSMKLPGLYAIDINSKFEIVPGKKDIEKIKKVKALL